MMKKIFFIFTSLISSICFSATVSVTCSTSANKAVINEVNSNANFIEIYLLQSSDVNNWELFVDASSIATLGHGNCYINGTSTKDNQGSGSNSSTFPAGTFITCDTNMNPSSNEVLLSDRDISHSGAPGAVAINYLGYGNLNNPSPSWIVPSQCGTLLPTHQANNQDIARLPDGTGNFIDNGNNNTKGTSNTGIIPVAYCTSFQYELYHPLSSTRKLQTRISQLAFDLNVTAACVGTGTLPSKKITNIYALNTADTCAITSPNLQVWSNPTGIDINDTLKNVTLTGLNSTKAFSNIKLMLKTSDNLYYCSADSMAIRPSSFNITSPASSIKAADVNLSVSAVNSGTGYNGTANVSTALQIPNANCPISSGLITSSTGTSLVFANDTNTTKMKATDVGSINLNIKDTSWTTIDQPNDCLSNSSTTTANAQGLVGCNIENNLSITIIPNHFDVNATLSNINGGAFTYLSTDLTMSANIDVNITAKNSDGNVTKNYTSGCFAKTTSLNLPHSSVPSPLSKIIYRDSLNAIDTNISASNPLSLSFSEAKFTQGSALPKITFNFDRNSSKPLNPFDFNLTSADVNNTDSVIGTTVPTEKATFVYGRARAYDMKTDQSTAPNPIELEIYSNIPTGYAGTMPQNTLNWYRNINHNLTSQGSVLRGGFSAGTTDSNINVSPSPLNGLHSIGITSSTNQTVHLDIPIWLWYSPTYNYNYTTSCLQHPCFDYQFFGTAVNSNGVQSGTFQGSDFTLTPAKTIIKKGVKVFR